MTERYQIHAFTQDGGDVHFECADNEDIISAALSQNIYLMSSCREGGCATCKAMCIDGEYELKGCSVQALPPDEEDDGQVLLCRTFPLSNLELELPYTFDRISFEEPQDRQAEVVFVKAVSSNVVQLVLRLMPDAGGITQLQFAPGQFLDLTVPHKSITRSYSPANLPNAEGSLEFLIRLLPDGQFSKYLRDEAQAGQVLTVKGPSGIFRLRENGLRPRYFIAGGTGLAPIVCMVRWMQDWGDLQETHIYFGVTHGHEVFYVDELKQLAASMPRVSVHVCVWQAEDEQECEKGNVIQILRRDLEVRKVKPDVYLCGPPAMVDAAHALCAEFGIPKDQIYLEKFLPSGSAAEALDSVDMLQPFPATINSA